MMMRYLTMLYYVFINLGLGEMGPINNTELLFCIGSMILSSIVFSNIFGYILSVNAQINQIDTETQSHIDQMNEVMNVLEL